MATYLFHVQLLSVLSHRYLGYAFGAVVEITENFFMIASTSTTVMIPETCSI